MFGRWGKVSLARINKQQPTTGLRTSKLMIPIINNAESEPRGCRRGPRNVLKKAETIMLVLSLEAHENKVSRFSFRALDKLFRI